MLWACASNIREQWGSPEQIFYLRVEQFLGLLLLLSLLVLIIIITISITVVVRSVHGARKLFRKC